MLHASRRKKLVAFSGLEQKLWVLFVTIFFKVTWVKNKYKLEYLNYTMNQLCYISLFELNKEEIYIYIFPLHPCSMSKV